MTFDRDAARVRRAAWGLTGFVAFCVSFAALVPFLPMSILVAVPTIALMVGFAGVFLCLAVPAWRFVKCTEPLLTIDTEYLVTHRVPGSVPLLSREAVSDVAVGRIPHAEVVCFRTASGHEISRSGVSVFDRVLLGMNLRRGRGPVVIVDAQLAGSIADVVRAVESLWPDVPIAALDARD
jgi:hypothetical protein